MARPFHIVGLVKWKNSFNYVEKLNSIMKSDLVHQIDYLISNQ